MWEYGVGATPAGELIDGENEAMDTVVGGPEPDDLHIMGQLPGVTTYIMVSDNVSRMSLVKIETLDFFV